MDGGSDPVSESRLAGLAIVVALGAIVATLGLIFSDPGDDAARVAYLVSLIAAAATAVVLPMLVRRRRIEIARLRADAAVLVFQLRAHATQLAQSSRWPRARLAEALRTATTLAMRARGLAETLTRAGVEQEPIELLVAIEAVEVSLRVGNPGAGQARPA
jgi:hypothetical protein